MTRLRVAVESPSIDLVSRRGFIRAGALAYGALRSADLLRHKAEASPSGGSSKAAIMIFLSGGPYQRAGNRDL